nr:sulfatase-like hydrolase/transferase [Paenibacillus sp.]
MLWVGTCSTPHLDALASDGIRFTDWYSNSPVCSPSRARYCPGNIVLHGKLDFSRTAADPVHLSNLRIDPGERSNVADRVGESLERGVKRSRAASTSFIALTH